MKVLNLTAATLKAILCFIDAEKTPKIAFDSDALAKPLADKIKEALGDRDGSQNVTISFHTEESELMRQFNGVCGEVKNIFEQIERFSK